MSQFRYKAFISYSHRDEAWASWLQRALERYRVPKRLVGAKGEFGPVPRRIAPVFRDREDLSSAADLSVKVKECLQASESLVVICSPGAAGSRWVNEEIEYFRGLGREERIHAVIVDGDPQAVDPAQQCFPPALTVDSKGAPREPLAADARKWADGKVLARLKLVAGILGVSLDDLRRRDMQRRHRLWMISTGSALAIALTMAVLAVVAVTARNAAEHRREAAEGLVGYMVGDLKSKLDEVGRLDILEGMGGRVSEYLQTLDPAEVTDESLTQQAQVWRQLGEVGMDQGDLPRALEAFTMSRDILAELQRRNPRDTRAVYELGNAEFWIGYVYLEQGAFDQAEKALYDYLGWAYRLSELEPGNAEWLMEQSYAHSNIAALAIRKNSTDVDEVLVHIEEAVRFNRKVIELAPDEPAYLGELGETMAWLADTQLLTCDLGGALRSRQENVELARTEMARTPGNVNLKRRYAYALTGLGNVSWLVGLVEPAIENFKESREIIGQLAVIEPSNVDFRFEYLMRDAYVARLLGESGRLGEGLERMAAVEGALEDTLESESYSNQVRHLKWIDYQLGWADMAGRSGEREAAHRHLSKAASQLQQLLAGGAETESFADTLVTARFIAWQQQDGDLFTQAGFENFEKTADPGGASCAAQANRVRRAILDGDMDTARQSTTRLLDSGYFEPGFVRICRQYGLCQGEG